MAFNDNPEVDDNSIRSEESVLEVKRILSRRNGFIFKDETPDYGVDLDVELMDDAKTATSHKFPVQIKSTNNIKIINKNGQEFISFPFETSRLGYLCKRIPAYGIITLYDEKSENTYFDYVDEIVVRLDNNKPNWKEQGSTTIHLPKQLLDKQAAVQIHARMTARFKSQQLLVFAQGASYDIPSFRTDTGKNETGYSIDFKDNNQVKEFLETYGLLLLNKDDIEMLLQMLESLPIATINGSSRLLVLSALSYGRAGYVIDAESFLRKCLNISASLSGEENELLESTRIRIAYFKGEIDESDFISRLDSLSKVSTNSSNYITFRINIVYLKLIKLLSSGNIDHSILLQIDELNSIIKEADIDEENRVLLTLFNCENLQMYTDQIFSADANKIKFQEKLGMLPPLERRVSRVRFFIALMNKATKPAIEIFRKYRDSDNNRLIGYSLLSIARAFHITQFTQLTLHAGEKRELIEGQDKAYFENENAALSASQHFYACKLFKEAHQALGIAYDIKQMAELRFGLKSGSATLEDIQHNLTSIEQITGIKPFKSVIRDAYHSINEAIERGGKRLKDYSPDEIALFARMLLEAYNLSESRFNNIMLDISNHQLFDKYAGDSDYELLHNQHADYLDDISDMYKETPAYQIRNKKTRMVSLSSKNLPYLLRQYGFML